MGAVAALAEDRTAGAMAAQWYVGRFNARIAWMIATPAVGDQDEMTRCPNCGVQRAGHYSVPGRDEAYTPFICPEVEDRERITRVVAASTPLPVVPPSVAAFAKDGRATRNFLLQSIKQRMERGQDTNIVYRGGALMSKTDIVTRKDVFWASELTEAQRVSVLDMADTMSEDGRAWERKRMAIVRVIEELNRNVQGGRFFYWSSTKQRILSTEGSTPNRAFGRNINREIEKLRVEYEERIRRNLGIEASLLDTPVPPVVMRKPSELRPGKALQPTPRPKRKFSFED